MGFKLNEIKHLNLYYNLNKNRYGNLNKIKIKIKKKFERSKINLNNPLLNLLSKFSAYSQRYFPLNLSSILEKIRMFKYNKPYIDNRLCNSCLTCIRICPRNAIINKKRKLKITNKCKSCNICIEFCPQHAIYYK